MQDKVEHFDVIIVGAGLSGIGAAFHLQTRCPTKTYAILEGRDAIGGTWDLFRYPGIRSDSDMHTLGYSFKPWTHAKAIADGPAILSYIRETAADNDIDRHIRFRHSVKRASWSSAESKWTIEAERGPEKQPTRLTCHFLFMCSGYYSYESGYTPEFKGIERFKGQIVHPQQWTDDIDYVNKRIVVIGSGATAVTLVPALAKTAAHVTMLQRSPTYIVSEPARDRIANVLRSVLPTKLAYSIVRWKNVLFGMLFFGLSRRKPRWIRSMILNEVKKELGEQALPDFTPTYNPWDQRLCLIPDGDLFEAIKAKKASIMTDHIESFTESGLRLQSGKQLEADLIVTATGLRIVPFGGMQVVVDDNAINLANTLCYKGMMFSNVPNLAWAFGYTNASWTLKCDLTCAYVCRLLNHMDAKGYTQCVPRLTDPSMTKVPFVDFSSGYVQRSIDMLPQQGSRAPWKLYQNYALDIVSFKFSKLDDDAMEFSSARSAKVTEPLKIPS